MGPLRKVTKHGGIFLDLEIASLVALMTCSKLYEERPKKLGLDDVQSLFMLKSREVPISQLRKTELAIGRAVDFNYGKAVFNLFRCSDSLYCYLVGTVIPKYRSLGWTFEYRAGDFRDSLRRLVPVSVVSWLARETSFGESIIVKHANAVILQK